MPNTLAHLGAQGIAGRALFPDVGAKWIALACVVPDIPWILQHAVHAALPEVDPFDLRLYAIAQASLAVSLMACGSVAVISAKPARVFQVLALGALLHLVLDALETKWGNGVHFLAPFSWSISSVGLVWPESILMYGLAALGGAYVALEWGRRTRPDGGGIHYRPRVWHWVVAVALFVGYLFVPLTLQDAVAQADSHYVSTLRHVQARTGKPVAFDRVPYEAGRDGGVLHTFAGIIHVTGDAPERAGSISVRAMFVDTMTVAILQYHRHGRWRDLMSYVGLALVVALWIRSLIPAFAARSGS